MRKYGLIGFPLGHSFSKKYFTEKFISENITDCIYENYPIDSIDKLLDLVMLDEEICGLNVTIPYKSEVFKFLTSYSREAEEIGAVNVIKIKRLPGHLEMKGFNSDITGIEATLRPYINDDLKNALILGTGGSSKAVRYVLIKSGITVNLVSREKKPGVLTYEDLNKSLIDISRLIINTTPLGMFPDTRSYPPIDYGSLTEEHVLFDLVYNPEMTSFLKKGKDMGCTVVSGLRMLHSQADKAWEIWNNDAI